MKGVLSIALEAKKRGRSRLFVPEGNAPEAAVIEGIQVFPIRSLRQALDFLNGDIIIPPYQLDLLKNPFSRCGLDASTALTP